MSLRLTYKHRAVLECITEIIHVFYYILVLTNTHSYRAHLVVLQGFNEILIGFEQRGSCAGVSLI